MNKSYFSHDLNARSDPKLMKLAMRTGMEGLGIYWCIIEMLYEQDGRIPLINIESIAFALHTECERIKDVLQNYDLFRFEGDYFTSDSVLKRIELINAKSETARQSALNRWRTIPADDANAMRTQCEGNAIKVNKSKLNKRKVNKFTPPTLNEVKKYFDEKGYTEAAAIKAFDYYDSAEWHDKDGNQVLSWKQKMISVWFRDEYKKPEVYKPILITENSR